MPLHPVHPPKTLHASLGSCPESIPSPLRRPLGGRGAFPWGRGISGGQGKMSARAQRGRRLRFKRGWPKFFPLLVPTILSGLSPPERTKVQLFGNIAMTAAIQGFKNQQSAKKILSDTPQIWFSPPLLTLLHGLYSPPPAPFSDHTEKITGVVLLSLTRQGPLETQQREGDKGPIGCGVSPQVSVPWSVGPTPLPQLLPQ